MGRKPLLVILVLCLFSLGVGALDAAAASAHRHARSACSGRSAHRIIGKRHRHRMRNHCAARHARQSQAARRPSGGGSSGSTSCANEPLAVKPNGASWTCTFDDEFDASTGDATTLNTGKWTPQLSATSGYTTGPLGYNVCYVDSPHNISVSDGSLHLTVRKEAAPFACGAATTQYTGGMVSTAAHFSQTYGRFEVRALLPQTTVAGLQETLWLWPVNSSLYGSWPGSGEVDFSEFYSQYPTLDIPYIHYDYASSNGATNTNVVTNYCPIPPTQYNSYAVTWSPGSFTITINGTPCVTDDYAASNVAAPAPFDQPFFIALTQALGVGTNSFNPATTPLPATTSIDYVRVWK